MMMLAPLVRGGNRHVALIMLEWLGLLLLLLLATQRMMVAKSEKQESITNSPAGLRTAEWFLILSPVMMGIFFLSPIPVEFWKVLPGRDLYSFALDLAFRPASLTPDATITSLLACIPMVAAFLWARMATSRQLLLIPKLLVFFALLQCTLGFLQVGPFKSLYFEAEFAGKAIGSFANANHFANYLTMCLPLAGFLIIQATGHLNAHSKSAEPGAIAFWSVALLLIAAGVLVSGSRGGLATSLVVLMLTASYLHSQTRRAAQRSDLVLAFSILLVLGCFGLGAFASRLGSGTLSADVLLRWREMASSWNGVLVFWPVGSGPGSFAGVYPMFQPPNLGGVLDYTHNDYVQLIFETGVLGLLVCALVVWLIVWRVIAFRRQLQLFAPELHLQVCCGLALTAIGLHSLVDFNLHIPANAMLASSLFGAFLRKSS